MLGKKNIPSGTPVIFAINHQNALMDALAVLFAAGRQTVFLARADIFRKKFMARLLRFLRILPVYRIRDGYSSLGQNQETFDEVNQVLRQNIPIGIFPEGYHLGKKMLKPLRKGIARMAFQAEEEAGFRLGLQIVPVGLDYSDYYKTGSDLLVIFGKPLNVADYKEKYLENPAIAMNNLLEDLEEGMRAVMIDIRPEVEYDRIFSISTDFAHAVLQEKGMPDSLQSHFVQQQEATRSLSKAYYLDHLIYNDLCDVMTSRIKNQRQMTSPFNHRMQKTSRALLFILLLPFSFYGAVVNCFPFYIPSRLTRKIRDPHFVSSVRFGAGFLLFVAWHFLLSLIIILQFNNIWVILALVLSLPVSAWISFFSFRLIRDKSV